MYVLAKEKKVTYLATSISHYTLSDFNKDTFSIPSNLPFFKLLGSDNTIVAVYPSLRDSDVLRYEKLFTGTLTFTKVIKEIIPRIKKLLGKSNRLNDDGTINSAILIAKNDITFIISAELKVFKIEKDTDLLNSSIVEATLLLNTHISPNKRLSIALKAELDSGNNLTFPIALLDTKSQKITYVKSLEDLWALK